MSLSLIWQDGLNFTSGPGGPLINLASSDRERVSPMQALAYAVMGCMGMDVAHVLAKGRHGLKKLEVTFQGTRAPEPPKCYTSIHLHFDVVGPVPEKAVARAIELSRSTYCSVSNSLRKDIEFTTTFKVTDLP
jgi:putative redox protein